MRKRYFLYLACGLLAAYLLLAPSPIDPVALEYPRMDLADNDALAGIEVLFPQACLGCEDISLSEDGRWLWTGHQDGRLLRFSLDPNAARFTEVVRFKSRPLGLEVLGDTLAWVCVEQEGLARVDLRKQTYEIVVAAYEKVPFHLVDYLDVGADGSVYFTDASDKYGDEDLQLDFMEGKPNGALYRYNPSTGTTDRLLDDLYFANGVALNPEETFLLVNETAAFRVRKLWLSGPKKGTVETIIEGLPGFPDGISLGTDGLFYLTLISPRTTLHDFVYPRPWTRTLVTKLPRLFWPAPARGNRILAIDDTGAILHDWMSAGTDYHLISGVERVGDDLWFGSLEDAGIGRFVVK